MEDEKILSIKYFGIEGKMVFPKNIMQIGTVDEKLKIYIEDYAHTYIKQMEERESRQSATIILYGRDEWYQECHYLFVYGVIEEKRDSSAIQEKYFSNYQMIGKLDVSDRQHKIHLKHGIVAQMKGYYVFYEQNQEMQSFLVNMNRRSELIEDREKYMSTTKMKTRNESRIQKEKLEKNKKRKAAPRFSMAFVGASAVIVLCGITLVLIINGQASFNEFVTSMARAVVFEEEILDEDNIIIIEESTSEKVIEESVEAVPDEILQEEITENEILEEVEEEQQITDKAADFPSVENEVEDVAVLSDSVQKEPETYVIQEGDTLESVCAIKYQDTTRVWEVCQLNGIEDADKIIQGQVILLP